MVEVVVIVLVLLPFIQQLNKQLLNYYYYYYHHHHPNYHFIQSIYNFLYLKQTFLLRYILLQLFCFYNFC